MYAVSAAHPDAVRIGMKILEEGGDACDGAVAVSLVLAVVEPFYSSLGGGGVTLIWRAKEEKTYFVDFSNECSRHIEAGIFPHDENGKHLTRDYNQGHRSILVPGLLRGLEEIISTFGSQSWGHLFEPAIRLAEEGFPVGCSYRKHQITQRFLELHESYPEFAKIHTKNGQPLAEGDFLRQIDLAFSLRRIAEKGAEEFYVGEIGDVLEKEIRKGGGLVDARDLAAYQVRKLSPLVGSYRDITYQTAPLPSSGLLLIQILNLVEVLIPAWNDANEGEKYVAFAKAMKSAFRDRFAAYGDPCHISIPIKKLQSKDYAE